MKSNPFITKDGEKTEITSEGYTYLDSILTDTKGQVYAFNHTVSPIMVAAAMARLSRRSSDLRITFLDEFAEVGESDASGLIKRVVTEFGDDSVQQLIGVHVVVEGASNLLTKLLEWGRYMAYLEQSTRYIFFDQKDANGKYLYFSPNLEPALLKEYNQTMDQVFDLYSNMVRRLTTYVREKHPEPSDAAERRAWLGATRAQACDAIRPVLPVSTKSTVGIYGSSQAVESLIIHLLSEPLEESQEIGRQILREVRKVIPAFLERTDLPERGGATTAYRATTRSKTRELADKYLSQENAHKTRDEVTLLDYWPKNELDLTSEILFEHSNLSIVDIEKQVSAWSKSQKEEIFETYIGERFNRRHKPGRAFEKAHFEWEIDGKDYGTFRDLQRHRVVDAFEWQRLTPYYGYEVPALVIEAGLEKEFAQCFELSSILYEKMWKAGYEIEAQYATLLGHRMRYRFILNARGLFHFLELRTAPQGHPGYRKICNEMYELLAKVYPLTAKAMKFVNQNEDPGLTRLAAERATQFKLAQLEEKKK